MLRNSLLSVVKEGLLGALLTGLMVLLFLRDWRSALIVVTTIPSPCCRCRGAVGAGKPSTS